MEQNNHSKTKFYILNVPKPRNNGANIRLSWREKERFSNIAKIVFPGLVIFSLPSWFLSMEDIKSKF